jgi:NAD(P)H-hydrate epimerase
LKLYIPESLNTIITTSIPEVVTVPLTEMRKGVIAINQLDRIVEDAKKSTVTAVGPGCGDTSELLELIRRLLRDLETPIILDADGLNALSRDIDLLNHKKSTVIVTPHPGEMSRLTGLGIKEINEDPLRVAKDFAKKFDVICILKGSRTVIASPSGELFINATGNPGMATAGSGDVLTGILTSLIAQGIEPLSAAMLAVYLHGYSGDRMAEKRGEYSLIASDIVEGLTSTLRDMSLENRENSSLGRI